MKKLLTATLAIAMGATCIGALAACNTGNDEETANKAITMLHTIYDSKDKETASSDELVGQLKIEETNYDVNWTVAAAETCTINDISPYVSVGTKQENSFVPLNIKKATTQIDYSLTASVTVGKVTKSASWDRYVPEGKDWGDVDVDTVELKFDDDKKRTTFGADQAIWEFGDITLTNDKADSVTACNNNAKVNPARFYKGSKLTIEYPGHAIASLIFNSADKYDDSKESNNYPASLLKCLQACYPDAEIKTDDTGLKFTVNLATPVDVFELSLSAGAGQVQLYSITIDAIVGGTTDQQKLDAAKAALDLATKNYSSIGSYDLPAKQGDATVTWTVTSEYANTDGGKLNVTTMPTAKADIELEATLSYNGLEATKKITVSLIPLSGISHSGKTVEDAFTATEAKNYINQMVDPGKTTDDEFYVKGYIIVPGATYNDASQYKNFGDVYIADSATSAQDSADAFYIFRPVASNIVASEVGFTVGDLITFKGKFQNYEKDKANNVLVPELVNGSAAAKTSVHEGKNDAEKAAAALADAYTQLNGKEVTSNITLICTVPGVTLAITGSDPTGIIANDGTVTRPASDTAVTLTIKATCGSEQPTQTVEVTVKAAVNLTGDGTLNNPYSVADVKDTLLNDVTNGYYGGSTPTLVHVKGYVVASGKWNSNNNNYTGVYIVDVYGADKDASSSDAIQVYGLVSSVAGLTLDATHSLEKGTLITLTGYLQNGNYGKQITYNSGTNPTVVKTEGIPDAVKVANALAEIGTELEAITEAGEHALPTVDGVTLAWDITEGAEVAQLSTDNTKLVVDTLPAENTPVKLTLTVTCGDATESQNVTVIVAKSGGGGNLDEGGTAKIDWTSGTNGSPAEDITYKSLTITLDKGTNSNPPKHYDTGTAVRAYGGNTLTFTVLEGYKITSIKFTLHDYSSNNALKANVGTYTSVSATEKTWTGSEKEVVITVDGTSGHCRIQKMEVTYEKV